MELSEIKSLINTPADLVTKIQASRKPLDTSDSVQYQPESSGVFNKRYRQDKIIYVDDPENEGQQKSDVVYTARIPAALQKLLVQRQVAFQIAGGIEFKYEPQNPAEVALLAMMSKTWQTNKIDFKIKEIAKTIAIEKECAILFYADKEKGYWGDLSTSNLKLKCTILSPLRGDDLYPIYDSRGDMIAFARSYKVKENEVDIEKIDFYTSDVIYQLSSDASGWVKTGQFASPTKGKIPIVFAAKDRVAWQDVQWIIDRISTLLSNHADTNDYNGSPILAATGNILGFSKKGEAGKVIELQDGADLKYVTWDSAPESIKLELENLLKLYYVIGQNPDISFSEMQDIGQVSTATMKLKFIDPILKAKEDQDGYFGEFVQRVVNLIQHFCTLVNPVVAKNAYVEAVFKDFFPSNLEEEIKNYTQLVAAGMLSAETALQKLGLVEDAKEEIQKRLNEIQISSQQTGTSGNNQSSGASV